MGNTKITLALLLLLPAFLTVVQAQVATPAKYTRNDSIEIYNWLNMADDADFSGKLSDAVNHVNKAMTLSKKCNFLRGEGFAWLKLADLRLKMQGADSLDIYYNKAFVIATAIRDDFLKGLAYFQRGQQLARQADFAEAEKNYRAAQTHFSKTDSTYYTAVTYNELGFTSERNGNYEDAVQYNLLAISLYDKLDATKEAANTKGNLGIIYQRMGNNTAALRLFKESAAARESIRDIKGLAAIYGNITMLYMPISTDSAKKYLALQTKYAELSGAKLNKAQAIVNAVALLSKEGKYEEALIQEKKAIALYEEAGDNTKLTTRYINAAAICNSLHDSATAELFFEKAETLAKKINSKNLLQNLYQQKADFYQSLGNYHKAYQYNSSYHKYKDSILNEKTTLHIAALQAKYDNEKKENEITRLATENKIKSLEAEKQKALAAFNIEQLGQKEIQIKLLRQEQELRDARLKEQKEELEKQVLLTKNSEQQLLLSVQQL